MRAIFCWIETKIGNSYGCSVIYSCMDKNYIKYVKNWEFLKFLNYPIKPNLFRETAMTSRNFSIFFCTFIDGIACFYILEIFIAKSIPGNSFFQLFNFIIKFYRNRPGSRYN